ncbi:GNAT family N-acetyltransferase [Nitrospirillum iridis]|uniref:GNAT superfamily N-acetyltransferase n=1 Tax=Nitrospirillum iridis TaxID=765888 RepID=A0A7X0EFZ9_9PROT|nr:GNAT family N-acetyltransferase [Nitrospirillum iridis]MBB6253019.1 GNAT superfamily N-acetyltransferase [Nitrospirillum iridis]
MIRDAIPDDFPKLSAMADRFIKAARWGIDPDPETITRTLTYLSASPDGALRVLVSDSGLPVGMAGGVLFPCIFNASHRIGQEAFVWVDPSYRGQGVALFRDLERELITKGAQTVIMANTMEIRPEAVGMLFRRMGYRPAETHYIKST